MTSELSPQWRDVLDRYIKANLFLLNRSTMAEVRLTNVGKVLDDMDDGVEAIASRDFGRGVAHVVTKIRPLLDLPRALPVSDTEIDMEHALEYGHLATPQGQPDATPVWIREPRGRHYAVQVRDVYLGPVRWATDGG